MKKAFIITGIVTAIAAAVICIGHATSEYYVPPVAVKTSRPALTPAPTPTATPAPEDEAPYWVPENIEELKGRAPEPVTEREYINHECGYKITFPESWRGWFLIDDSNPKAVDIRFYGKSEVSRFANPSSTCEYGVLMFTIVTESGIYETPDWGTVYDGEELIGYARGERVYDGATARTLGLFKEALQTTYYDEEERELVKKDQLKMKEMARDRAKYGFLYTTFEEIG